MHCLQYKLLLQIWNLNFIVSSSIIICNSLFQALITHAQNGSQACFSKTVGSPDIIEKKAAFYGVKIRINFAFKAV